MDKTHSSKYILIALSSSINAALSSGKLICSVSTNMSNWLIYGGENTQNKSSYSFSIISAICSSDNLLS